MSLLTAFKNSHILAGIYFIFLKKSPRLNLRGFQYQILKGRESSSDKSNLNRSGAGLEVRNSFQRHHSQNV